MANKTNKTLEQQIRDLEAQIEKLAGSATMNSLRVSEALQHGHL